ncbi:hypothetical protein VNO78_22687 [Psophocarpus tetragonolobus]|uniref:Uncharacterized protein n=1 Tax=Psophocarpus tetragonolobus TaxID=3891 RepID=A0AAN9S212_PSOTE
MVWTVKEGVYIIHSPLVEELRSETRSVHKPTFVFNLDDEGEFNSCKEKTKGMNGRIGGMDGVNLMTLVDQVSSAMHTQFLHEGKVDETCLSELQDAYEAFNFGTIEMRKRDVVKGTEALKETGVVEGDAKLRESGVMEGA